MAKVPAKFMAESWRTADQERLLAQLDHQLALSRLPGTHTPLQADLEALAEAVGRLRQMRAPLLVVTGRGPKAWLRHLYNLPLRLFGYKQQRFNAELLLTLDAVITILQAQQAALTALQSPPPPPPDLPSEP